MLAETQTRRRNLISLTPLIDVVFILLIFFMLASNFLEWRAIDLKSPTDPTGRGSSLEGSLLVEIRADGVRLSGRSLSLEELTAKVAEQVAKSPERGVFIKPARDITLQKTVTVLDALTAAGATNISLMKSPTK